MPDIKRQTAYKCSIDHINKGRYVIQQGWEPNYIELSSKKISRVNIIAVLISKEGSVLTIEDSTGTIEIRLFSELEKASSLNIGDIVLLIGRPREYNNSRYIVPEIIRKIENKKWVEYRQKELLNLKIELPKELPLEEINPKELQNISKDSEETDAIPDEARTNHSSIIIQTIRKLDKGDGAEISKVIKESKLVDAENYIYNLLNEGEIFEIRAGKVKVLE